MMVPKFQKKDLTQWTQKEGVLVNAEECAYHQSINVISICNGTLPFIPVNSNKDKFVCLIGGQDE